MGSVESFLQQVNAGHKECDDSSSESCCCLNPYSTNQCKMMHCSPTKQSGVSPIRKNCTTSSTILTTFSSYEHDQYQSPPRKEDKESFSCWGGILLESIVTLVSPQKKNAITYSDSISDFSGSRSNADTPKCQLDSSESWASPTGVQDFPLPCNSSPPNELLQLRPSLISEQQQEDPEVSFQDPSESSGAYSRERFQCHDFQDLLAHQQNHDDSVHLLLQNFLNTASKYEAESNLDAAISTLEQFLHQIDSSNMALFSRQHSKATTLHKVGVLHWKCGRYFFAEHLLLDTVHIYQSLLHECNNFAFHDPRLCSQLASETAQVFLSLGRVYLSKGEEDSALHCYNECVRQLPYVQSIKCSSTATAPARIFAQACVGAGRVLTSQGKPGQALKRYKRALKIQIGHQDFHFSREDFSNLSANDAKVPLNELAETLSHIGRLYEQKNDMRAMECHAKALSFYMSVLEHNAVDIGYASNNIGHVYHRLGQLSEAEEAFKTAHHIFALRLGKNHRNTAGALLNLGELYASQGLQRKALSAFKRVLHTESAVSGEYLSATYHHIACTYEATFRLQKALKYYQKELSVLTCGLQARHIGVARLLHHMADIAMTAVDSRGEYILLDQAANWLEQSAEIYYDQGGNHEADLSRLEASINETRRRMKRKVQNDSDYHI